MAPECEVLPTVPKSKKAMLSLTMDKLHLGLSATGHEFKANKHYILNKVSLSRNTQNKVKQ